MFFKLESTESGVKIIEIILGERHQVKTLRGECYISKQDHQQNLRDIGCDGIPFGLLLQ
jgi:hypothetical protein